MLHLRSIFILALAFLSFANSIRAQAEARPQDATSHLLQGQAVEQWLLQKPNLRPAVVKDFVDKDHLAERSSFEDYHPYYLVADFNGDKRDDFAIALVDTKNA